MNRFSRRRSNGKRAMIVFAALLMVTLLFGSLWYRNKQKTGTTPSVISVPSAAKVDLSPPTEQELNETAKHKDSLSNQGQAPSVDSNGKIQVMPVVTNASQNEVRGFIHGIVEEGGTCIASFKRGSFSFTRQSKGFGNVSVTNCEVISLTRSDFATPGEWTVTLSYTSPKAAGTSQPNSFEVK